MHLLNETGSSLLFITQLTYCCVYQAKDNFRMDFQLETCVQILSRICMRQVFEFTLYFAILSLPVHLRLAAARVTEASSQDELIVSLQTAVSELQETARQQQQTINNSHSQLEALHAVSCDHDNMVRHWGGWPCGGPSTWYSLWESQFKEWKLGTGESVVWREKKVENYSEPGVDNSIVHIKYLECKLSCSVSRWRC